VSKRSLVLAVVAGVVVLAGAAWWGLAQLASGDWRFSQDEDGIQAYWEARRGSPDRPPVLRLVCNEEDGIVWFISQTLTGDALEERVRRRHQLDLLLQGDGLTMTLEGYVVSEPGSSWAAWEESRTSDLLRLLSAPDFTVRGPAFSLEGAGAAALSDFARACPPVAEPATDALGWGTSTSLAHGYRIDVPRRLFRLVRGDRFGRFYESDTGASLTISGGVNALEQSLDVAIREGMAGLPALERETYRRVTRDSAAISGFAGGSIVYYRARSTCRGANIVSFVLTYDPADRGIFDAVAARMSKSLDRTTLPDGRPLCP
jgi:hypothetical protein